MEANTLIAGWVSIPMDGWNLWVRPQYVHGSILEYIKTSFEIRACNEIYYIITKQAYHVSLAIHCKFLFAILTISLSYCIEWNYAINMVHLQPLLQIFNIFLKYWEVKMLFYGI